MRKPIDSAILLAGCTALLYSWSTANYHGFLTTVSLDSDMMERSFHQVIYSGLVVSFVPILVMLFLVAFALFIWSHAILPVYLDWVRGGVRPKRRVIKFRRYWIGKRITPTIEKNEKSRFNRAAIYSLSGFAFIVSLIYFENKGQQQAKDIIAKHLAGENNPGNMISVVIGNNKKTLRYLGCGAKNCAGIEGESNRIYYFSQSTGHSFIYVPKNVTSASSG
jgi:hypothetical protein